MPADLTHAQIWAAIDALAARDGRSPSGLARLAGLDPTAFNKSKRLTPAGRPRWPSTESLAKVLNAAGASLDDFVALVNGGDDTQATGLRRIPVIGFAQAGAGGFFDDGGFPVGGGWEDGLAEVLDKRSGPLILGAGGRDGDVDRGVACLAEERPLDLGDPFDLGEGSIQWRQPGGGRGQRLVEGRAPLRRRVEGELERPRRLRQARSELVGLRIARHLAPRRVEGPGRPEIEAASRGPQRSIRGSIA